MGVGRRTLGIAMTVGADPSDDDDIRLLKSLLVGTALMILPAGMGDAVNVASRMESQGTAGMIQVTRATHDLIRDEFVLEPNGTISVKGRGEMEVWYLASER